MSASKKSLQIQKTYEALFALEDIREIFRQSLPTGFNEQQQEEFSETITRIKSIIADLESRPRASPPATEWESSTPGPGKRSS